MTPITETWRDVNGHEKEYQISNRGNVRSLDRHHINTRGHNRFHKGQGLKLVLGLNGYYRVTLRKSNGNRKGVTARTHEVHVLVAEAFLGNRPEGMIVNHRDEDKLNNHIYNLEYITYKENNNHGTRNERMSKSKTNGKKSKAITAVSLDGKEKLTFLSMAEAKRYSEGKFNPANISKACYGKYSQHAGYKWHFQEDYDKENK